MSEDVSTLPPPARSDAMRFAIGALFWAAWLPVFALVCFVVAGLTVGVVLLGSFDGGPLAGTPNWAIPLVWALEAAGVMFACGWMGFRLSERWGIIPSIWWATAFPSVLAWLVVGTGLPQAVWQHSPRPEGPATIAVTATVLFIPLMTGQFAARSSRNRPSNKGIKQSARR